jgi:hypothetical protein
MNKPVNIPQKNPFKVPDNYFEEVNRKIITATSDYKQEAVRVDLLFRLRPYLAIAASIAAIIIISFFTVNLLTVPENKYNISDVVMEATPDIYINDIDLFSLEENVAKSENYIEGSGVSSEEIIDYLMLENIEISDIYEQL